MWSHINDNFSVAYVSTTEDVKPIKNIPNGAILFEMDTAVYYIYDKENNTWHTIS